MAIFSGTLSIEHGGSFHNDVSHYQTVSWISQPMRDHQETLAIKWLVAALPRRGDMTTGVCLNIGNLYNDLVYIC